MTDLEQAEAQWHDWITTVADALGVDADQVSVTAIHELTRVIAHDFERPMAPVSAYIWGLAVASHPDADPAELRDKIIGAIPKA